MTAEELLELTAHGEHIPVIRSRFRFRKLMEKMWILAGSNISKNFPVSGVMAEIDGKDVYIGNSKFMNRQGLYYQPVSEIGTAVHVAVDGNMPDTS